MKKGELRRDAILKTAETLFFERGYEQTSIQDILDSLSISKGGFYHYFDSKSSLLEAVCSNRAAKQLERLRMELFTGKYNTIQRLNHLLGAMQTFRREEPAFAALLLRLGYIENDVRLREQLRTFLLDSLRPMVDEVVREGVMRGVLYTRRPGQIGRMLLLLSGEVNDEVCRMLAENPNRPDIVIDTIDMLDTYRESVENLCGAPFGSIVLFDVEQLLSAFRQSLDEINRE